MIKHFRWVNIDKLPFMQHCRMLVGRVAFVVRGLRRCNPNRGNRLSAFSVASGGIRRTRI